MFTCTFTFFRIESLQRTPRNTSGMWVMAAAADSGLTMESVLAICLLIHYSVGASTHMFYSGVD